MRNKTQRECELVVEAQRNLLASLAQEEDSNWFKMQECLYEIVKAETQLGLARWADAYPENHSGRTRKDAVDAHLGMLIRGGLNDTWSGRGNDLRRVKLEAEMQWIASELADFESEERKENDED